MITDRKTMLGNCLRALCDRVGKLSFHVDSSVVCTRIIVHT